MKFMVKWGSVCVFMLVALFSTSGLGFAQQQQEQPPSPPSANRLVSGMQRELDLTDEQASQIAAIITDEINQIQSLRNATKNQVDAIRQSAESKFLRYFTPEQLEKWNNRKQLPLQPPSQQFQQQEAGSSDMDLGVNQGI